MPAEFVIQLQDGVQATIRLNATLSGEADAGRVVVLENILTGYLAGAADQAMDCRAIAWRSTDAVAEAETARVLQL